MKVRPSDTRAPLERAFVVVKHGWSAWWSGAAYGALDEHDTTEEQTASIVAFLKRATSAEVHLYPQIAETWVKQHQYDYSRDERWRTNMNKKMGEVETKVDGLKGAIAEMHGVLETLATSMQAREAAESSERPAASKPAKLAEKTALLSGGGAQPPQRL